MSGYFDPTLAAKRYAPRPTAPSPHLPHSSFIAAEFDDIAYDDVLDEFSEVARLTLDDGFD